MADTEHGGFDMVLVEPLSDKLACPVCQLPMKDPQLTECGHHFCRSCLTHSLEQSHSCPICRTELIESKIFPNNALKREILDLKIKCKWHENGCQWVGELRDSEQHDKECRYLSEDCVEKCGEQVMRKDMVTHVKNRCPKRRVFCEHCGLMMQWYELQDHTIKSCDLCPVYCSYNCGEMLPRGQMPTHYGKTGTCPNSPLDCDFKSSGCQFTGNRSSLIKHIETGTSGHLSLIAMELVATKQMLRNTDQELSFTKQKLKDELAATTQTLGDELTATKQKLADTRGRLATAELQLCEELNRRSLSLPPHLPDQFIYTWKVDNWSQKVADAKMGQLKHISSNPFYVHPGYHLYLRVYPNSVQDDVSWLGVFLFPTKGDFDSKIQWPFPFSFALEVCDQQPNRLHLSYPLSPPFKGSLEKPSSRGRHHGIGAEHFASHQTLESRCYIKDNTIVVKLTIHITKN